MKDRDLSFSTCSTELTTQDQGKCMCVVNLSFKSSHYSKDVLSEDRAIGDASSADKSNFLHPVLYYYKEPIESIPYKQELIIVERVDTKGSI